MMKTYISSEELAEMLGIHIRQSRKIIMQVRDEMLANGEFVIPSRPVKVPTQKVMRKLGITE